MSYLTTDQFKVNSVNTIGNGERCEMDTTTWMVKWSNYQDGCVMTNSWLVKQKCKEFVKVAIEWIWCDMFKKKEGIYFKFSVSFICFSLHILVFLFHHFLTTNHKKKRRRWWTNESASWYNGEPILQMEMWATWQQTNSWWIQ